jgi:hypothetical protein
LPRFDGRGGHDQIPPLPATAHYGLSATPIGPAAPVVKLWLTPVPSRLTYPIVPVEKLAQLRWRALTITPAVSLAPVMKLC